MSRNYDRKNSWFRNNFNLLCIFSASGDDAHRLFSEILVRKFKRGNQRVLGKNWCLKVVINKFSMVNLEKKDLNFKFKVWWIENRTKSFQPHQGLALLVVLELVWSSDFLSIISKIGKPWNLFSSISLVGYHFISFSLVDYHFIRFSFVSLVSINENQLVMTNFDTFCHIHQHHFYSITSWLPLLISKN